MSEDRDATITARFRALGADARAAGARADALRRRAAEAVGEHDLLADLLDELDARDRELASLSRQLEELDRSSRARNRFLAVLSHDLRAPLNAVIGWTHLLRSGTLDEATRLRALATIERNANAQAALVEELLDIARITADKIQLELEPLDLGALVHRMVEGATPAARDRGLEIACQVETLLRVSGDRRRVMQIVTNLLSNALKYTASGGRVSVEAARDDAHVVIQVRDTGKGIPAALLPHVFEMYLQESDYDSAREGLGLGLYIVKQLVLLHGGTVEAASDGNGRGATFTVRLPAVDGDTDPVSSTTLEVPAVADLEGIAILVVDDEDDARELIATILRRAGAEVTCAKDAVEAVTLFEGAAPHVLVSDIAMPGADGFSLVRSLRGRDPTVGAVAVSGFASRADATRSLVSGYDAHLSKPVDPAELVGAVLAAARRGDA